MKKTWIKALERIFAAEIEGRLPLQSKAKVYEKLQELGYVTYGAEVKGRDRFGPTELAGWFLTQRGRMAYCETCANGEVLDDVAARYAPALRNLANR